MHHSCRVYHEHQLISQTPTASKLSKTSPVSVPHPWLFTISRERITTWKVSRETKTHW